MRTSPNFPLRDAHRESSQRPSRVGGAQSSQKLGLEDTTADSTHILLRPDSEHQTVPHESVVAQPRLARVLQQAFGVIRQYPLPLGVLALLLISLILWLLSFSTAAQYPLIVVGVIGGLWLLWGAARQLLRREVGVDVLALLAIGGSLALGQFLAGAIIVLMMSSGTALEAFALRRANSSLTALAERAPRIAHIVRGNEVVTIPAGDVEPGMEALIKPGEIVPVDGVVTQGTTSVSEADLTGEPQPVRKDVGSLILSGSVNLDTAISVRATKRSAESQYSQIIRLVEEAQRHKAPIHRLADRYALWFTLVALAIAGFSWLFTHDSIYALAVLVVATPCPLILATPIAIMSGVDAAARRGVIVKSGASIEQLSEVDVAIFDKTGTLTLGVPQLVEVRCWEPSDAPENSAQRYSAEQLLQLAAAVEQFSPHILARAVVDGARERHLPFTLATDLHEVPGKGARGNVSFPIAPVAPDKSDSGKETTSTVTGSVAVAIGNRTFMRSLDVPLPGELLDERERLTAAGRMASFVSINGTVYGMLIFADSPRPELARLAPALKSAGLHTLVLLTGDAPQVAEQIGQLAGMDRVVARCLPEDKVNVIEEYERQGRHTMMVGDGVNDAPALASATVGIAMGMQGLTAASTAADAILLSSDLTQVAMAANLGRHVVQVARLGIWIGIGLSIVAMLIAAIGWLPPTLGAFLQEGIDAVVILNAIRAGRMNDHPRSAPDAGTAS